MSDHFMCLVRLEDYEDSSDYFQPLNNILLRCRWRDDNGYDGNPNLYQLRSIGDEEDYNLCEVDFWWYRKDLVLLKSR